MSTALHSFSSTTIMRLRGKVAAIALHLQSFLSLLFISISAQSYRDKTHRRLVFFTDHPGRHMVSFNSLFALSSDYISLLRRAHLTMIFFISTAEGYEYARKLKLVEAGCLVVYLAPSLNVCDQWHGGLAQTSTYPIPIFTDLSERLAVNQEIKPLYLYLFLVFIWVAGFSLGGYFPKDDLLRHAIAYRWGYEYSIPYTNVIHSPSFDMYAGFDQIIGVLHRFLGDYALIVSQLASITLTFWAMVKFLTGMDSNLKLVVLTMAFNLLAGRFMLGRPSLLCSSIMLVLIAYDDSLKPAIKIALAAVMGMFYYLFFLYTIPLIINDRKYTISLLLSLAFWLWYAGVGYFTEVYYVVHSLSQQNMHIGENKTIFALLAGIWLLGVPWLLYWRRDLKKTFVTLFFLLSNQVRYIEAVIPLMVSFFRYTKLRIPTWAAFGIVFFLLVNNSSLTVQELHEELAKSIPAGSNVLTEDMKTMYRLLYFNPAIHISPSYCYGWTDPKAQAIIKDIFSGKVDCGDSFLHRFDYFVESHLKGEPPSCLQLIKTDGEQRLWRVDKQAPVNTVAGTILQ